MGKRALRKSDIKELNFKISFFELSKKDNVEVEGDNIFVNGKPFFFHFENRIIPHLRILLEKDMLKSVFVDMPAIKFLINGADVMRPGIVKIDKSIEKDELIAVRDEKHSKPICVGIALFSGTEMQEMTSGKVVRNIHYVGDKVWSIK